MLKSVPKTKFLVIFSNLGGTDVVVRVVVMGLGRWVRRSVRRGWVGVKLTPVLIIFVLGISCPIVKRWERGRFPTNCPVCDFEMIVVVGVVMVLAVVVGAEVTILPDRSFERCW